MRKAILMMLLAIVSSSAMAEWIMVISGDGGNQLRSEAHSRKQAAEAEKQRHALARPVVSSTTTAASGKSFKDCANCPEMVIIPQGSFMMGSSSSESEGRQGPVHRVTVPAFAMGKTEITGQQWDVFVKETGYNETCGSSVDIFACPLMQGKDSCGLGEEPAACVSWHGAKAYIQWLRRKTGKKYRLPTEAEWEYAARAGTTTSRYWGDSTNEACQYANVYDETSQMSLDMGWNVHNCNDGYAKLAPVGKFKPNDFGLYDMIGNVWEWVEDSYHDNYNGAPTDGSAWSGNGAKCVLRGGSSVSPPEDTHAAVRMGYGPENPVGGFRLARALP